MMLICVLIAGMLPIWANAVELTECVSNSTGYRATGSFNVTIAAGSTVGAGQSFPMAAGESVTINASYAPANASVDFGLVDADGIFHYFNVTNGSTNTTISIDKNGNYTLKIRNNSSVEVKVLGFVNY